MSALENNKCGDKSHMRRKEDLTCLFHEEYEGKVNQMYDWHLGAKRDISTQKSTIQRIEERIDKAILQIGIIVIGGVVLQFLLNIFFGGYKLPH